MSRRWNERLMCEGFFFSIFSFLNWLGLRTYTGMCGMTNAISHTIANPDNYSNGDEHILIFDTLNIKEHASCYWNIQDRNKKYTSVLNYYLNPRYSVYRSATSYACWHLMWILFCYCCLVLPRRTSGETRKINPCYVSDTVTETLVRVIVGGGYVEWSPMRVSVVVVWLVARHRVSGLRTTADVFTQHSAVCVSP